MQKLSKKHQEEAICPSCGEWKTTDFTPAELKEKEWECSECANKRITNPEDLPENRGQKLITKYDPEFDFLLKLVNTVVKAEPNAAGDIKALSKSHPFHTIDDAGDLAAQIWTLATEKYGIPRDWLIRRLPEKKSSLKQAYEGGYPTENDAVYWGTAPVNTYSDQPLINHDAPIGLREGDTGKPLTICPRCKSSDLKKEGDQATCNACGTNFYPKPDRGSDDPTVNDYSQNYFWGPNDLGRSHQNQPGANGWLPAGSEDMDGPSPNVRMSSLEKKAYQGEYWIDPNGKVYDQNSDTHADWVADNVALFEDEYGFTVNPKWDTSDLILALVRRGWTRVTSPRFINAQFLLHVNDFNNLDRLNDFVAEHFDPNSKLPIAVGTDKAHEVVVTNPFPSLQKAVNEMKRQPVMSSFQGFMHKQSSLNKAAHCGPCSVLKMEALHILIDLYYKDNSLFPAEVIEEISVTATELKIDNFNDILESVINEYLEDAEEVGEKLPKLKNLLIALKDIAPKLGKEIEVVDKQANLNKQAEIIEIGLPYVGAPLRVIVNPTYNEAMGAFKRTEHGVRYLEDDDNNLFIWPSWNATHEEVAGKLRENGYKVSNTDSAGFLEDETDVRSITASLNKQALEVTPRNPKPLIELKITYSDQEAPSIDEIVSQMEGARKKARESDLPFDIESIYKTGFGNELWIDVYASSVEEAVDKINSFFQAAFGQQRKQLSSLSNISLRKQANPLSRFWIAPDGKEFSVAGVHGSWVQQNKDILKQYGIPFTHRDLVWRKMMDNGWVRISNEPHGTGFQIQVKDMNNIPSFVDDFIAKNYKRGDTILVGDGQIVGIYINNPFPTLQKAINKELSHSVKASLLDQVLDQTTQDAIASEYGPQMLIALRFYNDGVRYGQNPQRSMEYAIEEIKKMGKPINQKDFLEVLNTYFQ